MVSLPGEHASSIRTCFSNLFSPNCGVYGLYDMILLKILNPITTILSFALALSYFRKEAVPFYKSHFPFVASMYSPAKMKEELKPAGIRLIVFGYFSFIVWMILS
jgi:hypothetical protein